MAQKEKITMSQLAFRLETELTKLSTNIDVAESLMNLDNSQQAPPSLNKHRSILPSANINKEYLSRIQEEIHERHYKLQTLTKKQEETNHNDVKQILLKTNNQMRKIEDMFFALNSGYLKQITPNSEQLIKEYNDKYIKNKHTKNGKNGTHKGGRRISTESKYGKVIKDGYLTKQGNVRKNWKKRLFILTTDGFLRYYDSKQRLLNEIDLSTAKFLSVETEHSHFKKPFVFTVKVPGREFIFAAENENVRKSWIAAIQKAMLKKSSSTTSGFYGQTKKKHDILYKLTKLEWKQLQNADTFADLQEELEEIADVQLVPPNKLKITATSDSWVARHTVAEDTEIQQTPSGEDGDGTYIDWDEMIQKVKQFFEKAHGDVIMQGWLLKKMEFRNWKKRWVVIKKDMKMEYYLNTKADKKRGTINLANMKYVKEIFIGHRDIMKSEPDCIFEIENGDRKVRFACSNKEELQLWLKTIQEHCRYLKTERANSEDSDGDEPLHIFKRVRKEMIDPIIV